MRAGESSGSVSRNALKSACAVKYQTSVPDEELIDGQARFDNCSPKDEYERDSEGHVRSPPNIINKDLRICTGFSGDLENKSTKYVVTSTTVVVKNKGYDTQEKHVVTDLWIEPGKKADFAISLDNKIARPYDENPMGSRFGWTTEATKGLVIDY
jgi:hypothetical protein